MYRVRAFIPYNCTEPITRGFETRDQAIQEIEKIAREGMWYKDTYYFPGWIKRLQIEEMEETNGSV